MKILFVSSGNPKTGISIVVKNQGEALRKNGINLDYFTIDGNGLKGYLKHIFLLKKKLKKDQYDIIHAHYGLCGIVAYTAKRKGKLIVSFMGDDIIGENRFDGSYTLFGNFLVLINKWYAKRKFKTIIVKSKQMRQLIKNSNSIVLPNGVDFTRFHPIDKKKAREKLAIEEEGKIILFVGDPNRPEKNYRLAENAFKLLKDDSCKLHVVNGVSPGTLKSYYNLADVCLLTSFHEGSPNVIKEAMACNCPIVATDVGDVKEVISGTEGCYITSYDPQDVAEKLKLALSFGKRTTGRADIRYLDSTVSTGKLIDIYRNEIEEPGKGEKGRAERSRSK